jgi:alcohol dehydrogenase class IV
VEVGVRSLICAIQALLQATGTPATLQELGIGKEAFGEKLDSLCEAALQDKCTATNPRTPDKQELSRLFWRAYGQ